MEATKEDIGFLEKIRPPRLEDAGLEECALPPDSIMEAFLKAATAVSSRSVSASSSSDESDGDCVNDLLPRGRSPLPPSEALVGIEPAGDAVAPCAAEKGGALIGDEDLGGGTAAGKEEVIIVPVASAEAENGFGRALCVDGMRNLKIGEK